MDRRITLAASRDEPVTEVTRTTTKIQPRDSTKTCCTESIRAMDRGELHRRRKSGWQAWCDRPP